MCELLDGAGAGDVIALGGGSVLSERVRAALEPHSRCCSMSTRRAWERSALGACARPLARERERSALHAARARMRTCRRVLPTLRAERSRARALHAQRRRWCAPAVGELGLGRLSRARRPRPAGGRRRALGRIWPLDRSTSRPFCVSDETVAGALRRAARRAERADDRDRARRAAEDARERRAGMARARWPPG